MEDNNTIQFRCIEITQPIGTFYLGNMDSKDLTSIAWADIIRIEDRDVEKYLGVERPLSKDRVQKLSKYVNTIDATFPTSIILAISSKQIIDYDKNSGLMIIKRDPKTALILDGQHRIAGLKAFTGTKFELNVVIFIDIDLEDQGMIFATINLEQTKVSKSIGYALYEYAKSRSPYKTCHNIAKLLNRKTGSPFKDKIKMLGIITPGITTETITLATFIERLLPLISIEPMTERDILKRGRKLNIIEENKIGKRVFINIFREDRDADIARILWNYFSAVNNRWEKAWTEARSGNILNRTAGFTALMNLLPALYRSYNRIGQVIEIEYFNNIFKKIRLNDDDFNPDKYVPGNKGERALLYDLLIQSGCIKNKY